MGVFLFWAHRRVPSLVLFVLVLAWSGFLFTGFFFSAITVHARNQTQDSERRDPGVNVVNRAIFESWSWLYNDSALNDRRRENLHGLFLWLIAGGLIGVSLGSHCSKRTIWIVRGVFLLLLFFMFSRLPQAYAYAVWGLKYPQVTLERDSSEPYPTELKAGCCLFDVSAGALETVLWIRCPGDYPGRWLIPEEGVTHRLQRMGKPLVVVNSPCDQKE